MTSLTCSMPPPPPPPPRRPNENKVEHVTEKVEEDEDKEKKEGEDKEKKESEVKEKKESEVKEKKEEPDRSQRGRDGPVERISVGDSPPRQIRPRGRARGSVPGGFGRRQPYPLRDGRSVRPYRAPTPIQPNQAVNPGAPIPANNLRRNVYAYRHCFACGAMAHPRAPSCSQCRVRFADRRCGLCFAPVGADMEITGHICFLCGSVYEIVGVYSSV
ncbi:protein Shroom4-like [Folsomia candida]|nr:protein Shroom4-like [Folsomia candida]